MIFQSFYVYLNGSQNSSILVGWAHLEESGYSRIEMDLLSAQYNYGRDCMTQTTINHTPGFYWSVWYFNFQYFELCFLFANISVLTVLYDSKRSGQLFPWFFLIENICSMEPTGAKSGKVINFWSAEKPQIKFEISPGTFTQ